jgi:methyl-accepting chemotaxis protein
MMEEVKQTVQLSMQMAVSTQQQREGMDQMALAIQNINQASAQSAVSTKQIERAAQNLHELGLKLK